MSKVDEGARARNVGFLLNQFAYAANNSIGARRDYFIDKYNAFKKDCGVIPVFAKGEIPISAFIIGGDSALEFNDMGVEIKIVRIKRESLGV